MVIPCQWINTEHDDVIKWKYFPCYWPFVRGIHRSPVNSPHKGKWRGALVFSLICVWINGWINNRQTGDLRRYPAHYDVILMKYEYDEYSWFTSMAPSLFRNRWWLIITWPLGTHLSEIRFKTTTKIESRKYIWKCLQNIGNFCSDPGVVIPLTWLCPLFKAASYNMAVDSAQYPLGHRNRVCEVWALGTFYNA